LDESRESLTARGLESDEVFENYRRKTEHLIENLRDQLAAADGVSATASPPTDFERQLRALREDKM
jgi:hypothetical protein